MRTCTPHLAASPPPLNSKETAVLSLMSTSSVACRAVCTLGIEAYFWKVLQDLEIASVPHEEESSSLVVSLALIKCTAKWSRGVPWPLQYAPDLEWVVIVEWLAYSHWLDCCMCSLVSTKLQPIALHWRAVCIIWPTCSWFNHAWAHHVPVYNIACVGIWWCMVMWSIAPVVEVMRHHNRKLLVESQKFLRFEFETKLGMSSPC